MPAAIEIRNVTKTFRLYHEHYSSLKERMIHFGRIPFEDFVALNDIGYAGPLSVEWEDSRMDRVHGATESAAFCRRLDFEPAKGAFDAVFDKSRQAGA